MKTSPGCDSLHIVLSVEWCICVKKSAKGERLLLCLPSWWLNKRSWCKAIFKATLSSQEGKRNPRGKAPSHPQFRTELQNKSWKHSPFTYNSLWLMKKHLCGSCRNPPPGRSKKMHFSAVQHSAGTSTNLELTWGSREQGARGSSSEQGNRALRVLEEQRKTLSVTKEIVTNIHLILLHQMLQLIKNKANNNTKQKTKPTKNTF